MKRSATALSGPNRPAKRSKSIQACASCRKHKTRCEILDLVNLNFDVKCHRCKVLSIECSYSDMDKSLFQSYLPPNPKKKSACLGPLEFIAGWPPNILEASTLVAEQHTRSVHPRSGHLWQYIITPLDWSSPMTAIQELMSEPSATTAYCASPVDVSLDAILSCEQISQLLNIFNTQYLPWLNISIIRDVNGSLIDMAQCCVASRHLEADMHTLAAPRLQRLIENKISKILFNVKTYQSLEAIQCLLILSLWPPISCTGESCIRDFRALMASAVSMAMNMKLHLAAEKLQTPRGEDERETETIGLQNKARLWLAITNTESLLYTGSGRGPLSCRSDFDLRLIDLTSRTPSTVTECRDMRLRLLAELYSASEKIHEIHLGSTSRVDEWYDDIGKIFERLSFNQRVMVPLEIVTDYEQPYFHMLLVIHRTCRLLVLYHAMYDARMIFKATRKVWMYSVQAHGMSIFPHWGREVLCLGEMVMVDFIKTDPKLLSTAPDSVFTMLAFVAGVVVGIKFLLLRKLDIELIGSSEKLLSRTLDHLYRASLSPEHAANRTARLIGAMMGTWENRQQLLENLVDYGVRPLPLTGSAAPKFQGARSESGSQPDDFPPLPEPQVPSPVHGISFQSDNNGTHWMLNSNLLEDAEFWAQLLGTNYDTNNIQLNT